MNRINVASQSIQKEILFAVFLIFSFITTALATSELQPESSLSFIGGDQLNIIGYSEDPINPKFFGLIKNHTRIILKEEITGFTESLHSYFHLAWNDTQLFLLSPGLTGQFKMNAVVKTKDTKIHYSTPSRSEIQQLGLDYMFNGYWTQISLMNPLNQDSKTYLFGDSEKIYELHQNKIKTIHSLKTLVDRHETNITLADYTQAITGNITNTSPLETDFHIWASTPLANKTVTNNELKPGALQFEILLLKPSLQKIFVETQSQNNQAIRSINFFSNDPSYFLEKVYQQFKKLETSRPAFNENLIQKITQEDQSLPRDRMIYLWSETKNGLHTGGIRLFQGYEHQAFLSKNILTPTERTYPDLNFRSNSHDSVFYELNRLYIQKESAPWLNTKKILTYLFQYFESRQLPDGQIIIHTDLTGSEFYQKHFKAKILFSNDTLLKRNATDTTEILTVSTQELRQTLNLNNQNNDQIPSQEFIQPRPWCAQYNYPQ
jgi:hypothetical protein